MQHALVATTFFVIATATASCAPPESGSSAASNDYAAEVSVTQPTAAMTTSGSDEQSDMLAQRAATRAAAAHLDFGPIPLGEPIRALPQGANWQQGCDIRTINGCGFELNGVRYGTDWEANIVVVKTIDVGNQRPTWLPFELRGDETIEVALANLNEQFSGVFEIGSNDTGERFVIAHSGNARLDYFEVSLRFERGDRLSEVRASCCYN